MKQVTQRLRDGRIEVLDVPPPVLRPDGVLVDVRASLLSAGTERTKVETGQKSLIGKARARPDQVRQVLDKARRDGVRSTIEAVRIRLDQPSGLGYSASGVVLEVGERVTDLAPGDRVACGGSGYAEHADIDYVPANLCVRLPDAVSFSEGAFATVGAVALHGVRQADARLGERITVIGLGLVGQLTCQLLRAAGCRVVGIDLSRALIDRVVDSGAAARGFVPDELGRHLPADATEADAVIITAATPTDDPVTLAARLCRDRGRVVVVGDVGMGIPRAAYYDKEIELRISRSYGPGRYDAAYEEKGLDYPVGYVRWTERRNMAAFVELVATGRVDVSSLITTRLPVAHAGEAYERLRTSDESPLGVVLEYAATAPAAAPAPRPPAGRVAAPRVGVIGAGSFAQRVLIPALRDAGFHLRSVASATGISASAAAGRFGFDHATTPDSVMSDPDVDLVVIATRHDTHAALAIQALDAGKHVFVEKPPCLTLEELTALEAARDRSDRELAVGFNRRHAPLAVAMRDFLGARHDPIEILYRVSAGRLPPDHWLNDLDNGGGRLLGEGCHFVDFACWLAGDLPATVTCAMGGKPGAPLAAASRFTIALGFGDGSVASILYGTEGSTRVGKEYVEVHSGGRSAVLTDFRELRIHDGSTRRHSQRVQDKGQRRQAEAIRARLTGEPRTQLDPLATMRVTLATARSVTSENLLKRQRESGNPRT